MNRALDSVKEGIITTDEEFRIKDHNRSFYGSFNVNFRDNSKIIELLSFPRINTAFETVLGGGTFSEETPVYFGTKRVECKVTVFREDGLIYWIFEDITDMKLLENAKADFVAAVSHEFMTPLGVIGGFLSLIEDPNTPDDLKANYTKRANVQLKRLEKLVDQLLSLSELEMKNYVPHFSIVNIPQLVAEVKEDMSYKWKAKNLRIDTSVPEDLFVYTEGTALYRMVANLLSNSIKYSHEGGTVFLKVVDDEDRIFVTLEDEGIGIREEELPRIFERFYRASNSSETGAKGMGLGLALVKHLSEITKADITVESRYTLGSTFTITLPKKDYKV